MNINERVERIRELMVSADPMPWSRDSRNRITDAKGRVILDPVSFDPLKGVTAENDANTEIVEHLSHIAHEDFLVVVPEMEQHGEIAALQKDVFDQANRLFPKRTPSSAFLKLYEELGEVIRDPKDASEWADVFIMLLDLSKIYGINIASAVREKMAINDDRIWTESDTGTYQHKPNTLAQLAESNRVFPRIPRIDIIGQNGNTGDHYGVEQEPIPSGVYVGGLPDHPVRVAVSPEDMSKYAKTGSL